MDLPATDYRTGLLPQQGEAFVTCTALQTITLLVSVIIIFFSTRVTQREISAQVIVKSYCLSIQGVPWNPGLLPSMGISSIANVDTAPSDPVS